MTERGDSDVPEVDELSEVDQRQLLLNFLLAHKKGYITDFLRERGISISGEFRKAELPDLLLAFLDDGSVTIDDLVLLLNRIEGWGNQHIYLYNAADRLEEDWKRSHQVQDRLNKAGIGHLLNNALPLVLPSERTLAAVELGDGIIRFVWVERRVSRTRAPEYDFVPDHTNAGNASSLLEDEIVFQAYRQKISRGLVVFEWDLATGQAMLRIQRLPSDQGYKSVRDELEDYLAPIFGFTQLDRAFEPVLVSTGIRGIQASGETRRQHLTYRSLVSQGTVAMSSRSSDTDVLDSDSQISEAHAALDKAAGLLARVHWIKKTGGPSVEVYTHIYGEDLNDQRIAILAEHTEENVRHVLSRVRYYCI